MKPTAYIANATITTPWPTGDPVIRSRAPSFTPFIRNSEPMPRIGTAYDVMLTRSEPRNRDDPPARPPGSPRHPARAPVLPPVHQEQRADAEDRDRVRRHVDLGELRTDLTPGLFPLLQRLRQVA